MEREIKFRAFDEINNEMIYPNEHKQTYKTGLGNLIKHYDNLMQYIGQKDKNGVEIYECDIVKHDKYINRYREVRYSIDWCAYQTDSNDFVSDQEYEVDYSKLEVVGNIYQNKDLLK